MTRHSSLFAFLRSMLSVVLMSSLFFSLCTCGGSQLGDRSSSYYGNGPEDPDVVRYRLLLRNNPVDKGEAFRCYGACQAETTPPTYLQCLSKCPGFEVTDGMQCARREVPPVAVCLVGRKVKVDEELEPGWIVVAVVANVLIVVAAASLCASSDTQCYSDPYYYYNGPGGVGAPTY